MPSQPPLWRRAFDAVEKPLGDALAQGARSGAFADVVAVGVRVERLARREVERRTRRVLHLANLPTATDVRRLTQQVTELQRQVRALSREVEKR
jgi:polyhydroxyalkanoate synthesis regulator phasin